jgi:DNA modification methylase
MSVETFLNGRVQLFCGDSRDVLKAQPDSSIDSVVCDPPYALVSVIQRFGNSPRSETTENVANPYGRTGRGFMGQKWDTGETAFAAEFWAEVLRVLKPGGHVVAFSGTRTVHRLVCAIEDAGFEIRDQLQWLYGSGFPKSHDVSKGLGKQLAAPDLRAEWEGWGTALKPAVEPICLARKPLIGTVAGNVLAHGTGAINIDGCRVHADDAQGGEYTVTRLKPGATLDKTGGNWRPEEGGVLYHGEMKPGRWPANVLHDGSAEVMEAFPDAPGQQQDIAIDAPSARTGNVYGKMNRHGEKSADARYTDKGSTNFAALPGMRRNDSGSAARFFYAAKADGEDRLGSKHPTVKPVDLMQWLCRLVTPKGGTVLDPFAGTGTTGEAAFREGFNAILIERETEYQADIRRRMALVMSGPEERKRESIKAKVGDLPFEAGSLFASLQSEAAAE